VARCVIYHEPDIFLNDPGHTYASVDENERPTLPPKEMSSIGEITCGYLATCDCDKSTTLFDFLLLAPLAPLLMYPYRQLVSVVYAL